MIYVNSKRHVDSEKIRVPDGIWTHYPPWLDHGGSWFQVPSGTRIFSESTYLQEFDIYHVVVISLLKIKQTINLVQKGKQALQTYQASYKTTKEIVDLPTLWYIYLIRRFVV